MTANTHPAPVRNEMNRRPLTDAEGRGDRTPRESPGQTQHGAPWAQQWIADQLAMMEGLR